MRRAGRRHGTPRGAAVLMGAAALLSALGALAWSRADPHLARTRGGWALIRSRRLPDGTRVRVLRQGGVYQSATYLDERRFEPPFAYQRAFDAVFDAEDGMRRARGHGIRRVLALGGGGYAWPKHALSQRDDLLMDVVEIDEAVMRIARRWFFVDELERLAKGRLRLVCADGRAYLEGAPAGGYDAVVNDTFAGDEPVVALATVEAMRAARACLAAGGLYLANVVSRGEGGDVSFLRDAVATCAAVFAHVWVLPASDEDLGGEDNYLVVASDDPYRFPEAIPYDEAFMGAVMRDPA